MSWIRVRVRFRVGLGWRSSNRPHPLITVSDRSLATGLLVAGNYYREKLVEYKRKAGSTHAAGCAVPYTHTRRRIVPCGVRACARQSRCVMAVDDVPRARR